MNQVDRFKKIVSVNGRDFQFEISLEEASEYIHAIQKYKRGKASLQYVISELADVLVTFGCMREALREEMPNIDDYISNVIKTKTNWIEDYDGKADKSLTWQDFKDE